MAPALFFISERERIFWGFIDLFIDPSQLSQSLLSGVRFFSSKSADILRTLRMYVSLSHHLQQMFLPRTFKNCHRRDTHVLNFLSLYNLVPPYTSSSSSISRNFYTYIQKIQCYLTPYIIIRTFTSSKNTWIFYASTPMYSNSLNFLNPSSRKTKYSPNHPSNFKITTIVNYCS